MRRYFSTALIFMLFFQIANAQYNFSAVDDALKTNQKVLGNNFVVLVYKDTSLIYKNITGESTKIDGQEPIYSSSRWLTTALVMTFVDEGKISLDDELSRYLTSFVSYSKGNITIKDCLANTMGISIDTKVVTHPTDRKKYESLEAEVNAIAAKRDIVDRPGKQFFYGNEGLDVAARVCEIVSKKPFERLMQERITRPLQMRKTNFQTDGMEGVDPSAGGKSSATDYIKFLMMLVNKGMYNGKKILSEESVALMMKSYTNPPTIKYTPAIAANYNYALGAWIQEADESGKPTVLTCPAMLGVWPYIDLKKNYACIIFTKTLPSETKRDVYLQIKQAIDEQIK